MLCTVKFREDEGTIYNNRAFASISIIEFILNLQLLYTTQTQIKNDVFILLWHNGVKSLGIPYDI